MEGLSNCDNFFTFWGTLIPLVLSWGWMLFLILTIVYGIVSLERERRGKCPLFK